ERNKGKQVLDKVEQLGHQSYSTGSLLASSFELIVESRILELVEVQCGGVFHQSDAGTVREEIAEKAFHKRRSAAKQVASQYDTNLGRDQFPKALIVRAQCAAHDNGVDNQLAYPEGGYRNQ